MAPGKTDRGWEWYGRSDPYFAVLTENRFRRAELTTEAIEEFFASGERYVQALYDAVERVYGSPFRPRRALDFGCGVGRLLIPIARRAAAAVGVDVSTAMLSEAAANCARSGVDNATFATDVRDLDGTFDFIHSFIVFQHVPVAEGEAIAQRMLDMLEDDGIGALHFTYRVETRRLIKAYVWAKAHVPLFNAASNVLRCRDADAGVIQMNEYSLERIMLMLERAGCHEVHARTTCHGAEGGAPAHGLLLLFRKKALATL